MYSKKEYLIHGLLFVLTLITATLAGGEWVLGKSVLATGEQSLSMDDLSQFRSFFPASMDRDRFEINPD